MPTYGLIRFALTMPSRLPRVRLLDRRRRRGIAVLSGAYRKDVLYVVQHELKRSVLASGGALDEASARAIGDAALAFVRNMTENATAVGADASDLWLADKYLALHRDYEDNLVLAACKRAQVDYLVTNDRKLLEHADLAAKTPHRMMPILALAERGGAAIG